MIIAIAISPNINPVDLIWFSDCVHQATRVANPLERIALEYCLLKSPSSDLESALALASLSPNLPATMLEYDQIIVLESSDQLPSPDFENWLAARRADSTLLRTGNRYEIMQIGFQLAERIARKPAVLQLGSRMGFPIEWIEKMLALPRQASLSRKTKETSINLELSLDGSGKNAISTGLPFFDHMLSQIAVHGLFDLSIQCKGDLQVDAHHTVEDVALALGKAFDQALGDRKGLVRMASATVPMDESLAQVVLDFSGRPCTKVEVEWNDIQVGGLPVSLIPHFLESFAVQARCNLFVQLLAGGDDHHRAEAIFKALARGLDAATRLDPRQLDAVPSSKGVL